MTKGHSEPNQAQMQWRKKQRQILPWALGEWHDPSQKRTTFLGMLLFEAVISGYNRKQANPN